MANSQIRLVPPKGLLPWLELYRLYRQAFPRSEQKPFSMIVNMYRKGKTDVWCIEHEGVFSGLAITINSPEVILLDYFAVSKNARGGGIGTQALKALLAHYVGKGLFVEIENPEIPADNQADRIRRKKFYVNCGLKPMGTLALLFGVEMELLGAGCHLTFEEYRAFYRDNYNAWAANHITSAKKK